MTDWSLTALVNAALSHKKPFTVQAARQLRDNVIAMAEGAPGAPKIARKNQVGSVSSGVVDLTNLDDFSGLKLHIHFRNVGGVSRNLELEISTDATTFPDKVLLLSVPMASSGSMDVYLDFATGAVSAGFHTGSGAGSVDTTIANASTAIRTVRVRAATDLSIGVLAHPDGGESAS